MYITEFQKDYYRSIKSDEYEAIFYSEGISVTNRELACGKCYSVCYPAICLYQIIYGMETVNEFKMRLEPLDHYLRNVQAFIFLPC